ncbi:MAG TPA: hypothetical protein VN744_01850 [Casimicrobiaceae bacterium]|nr:hypothetical protein [Casimicrobiaceae bacterium]
MNPLAANSAVAAARISWRVCSAFRVATPVDGFAFDARECRGFLKRRVGILVVIDSSTRFQRMPRKAAARIDPIAMFHSISNRCSPSLLERRDDAAQPPRRHTGDHLHALMHSATSSTNRQPAIDKH